MGCVEKVSAGSICQGESPGHVYHGTDGMLPGSRLQDTLEDLQRIGLGASGGAAQILAAWGANPVGMPMPATVEALQKGVVKGLFSSLRGDEGFQVRRNL